MTARQTAWPRTWLMTDERLGIRLWEAIDRLPKDSGIVFRHYALARAERLQPRGGGRFDLPSARVHASGGRRHRDGAAPWART